MKAFVHNFDRPVRSRARLPLVIACLLPLSVVGVTVEPALHAQLLSRELERARQRSEEARAARAFLDAFGPDGPPTERYQRVLDVLVERIPHGFEPSAFFERVLSATAGLDISLDLIDPQRESDLGLTCGPFSIHERRVGLRGSARAPELTRFVDALRRAGQPACVHACNLRALENEPGRFDFQLALGAFFLAPPSSSQEEADNDS